MNICVDPIDSPEAWRAYVDDIQKEHEKVLFRQIHNLEYVRDPIQYLATIGKFVDHSNAKQFIGLTVSWRPEENPSPAQMQDTIEFMLEQASPLCHVTVGNSRVPAEPAELPRLQGGHLNTGHPHVHVALGLVHPVYRKSVILNNGWETKLFQHVARHAEKAFGWCKDENAPEYKLEAGKLVLLDGYEEGFRLTPAQRVMEWINGECAKRALRRHLRNSEPAEMFHDWSEFSNYLRDALQAAYLLSRSRFYMNTEIVPAREVGPQWTPDSLTAAWGACPIYGSLGLPPEAQVQTREARCRIEGRLSPETIRAMADLTFHREVQKEIEDFCQKLNADFYRVIIEDVEGRRERLNNMPGQMLFSDDIVSNLRGHTFEGKTVSIIPEKQSYVPLPVSGPCHSFDPPASREAGSNDFFYTPAAKFQIARNQETALIWAESLGSPADDYNAGREFLRAISGTGSLCFPHQSVPCPGLHQAAGEGDKCIAYSVTGQTCQIASQILRQCLHHFKQREERWRKGELQLALEKLQKAHDPVAKIYQAHAADLLKHARTRCHTMDEVDIRIAVRLLTHQSRESVEDIIATAAPIARAAGSSAGWEAHAAAIVAAAQFVAKDSGEDGSSEDFEKWNAVTGSVFDAAAEMRLNEMKDLQDDCGNTALHDALSRGPGRVRRKAVSLILGVLPRDKVNLRDEYGSNLLHLAASFSPHDPVLTEMLIQAKVEINACDANGRTPLRLATFGFKAAAVLLRCGANPNSRDRDGWTPLHAAASWDSTRTILLLLKHGSNVLARDRHGNTALHLATPLPHNGDTVAALVKAGAEVNAKNKHGKTPLELTVGKRIGLGVEGALILLHAGAATSEKILRRILLHTIRCAVIVPQSGKLVDELLIRGANPRSVTDADYKAMWNNPHLQTTNNVVLMSIRRIVESLEIRGGRVPSWLIAELL